MGIAGFFKGLFNKFVSVFKAFLDEAIPLASQIIMGQLKDIALMAVTEMASTNLSNEEKRKAAVGKIKDYAKSKAIPAKDSLINALTEIAYLKFKMEF